MAVAVKVSGSVPVDPTQFKSVKDLLTAILTSVSRGTEQHPLFVSVDTAKLESAIGEVASALKELAKPPVSGFHFIGGGFVRTYAGDRPAEDVAFSKPQVVDSEGTPLSPQPDLSYTFSSSNEAVVKVTDNGNGSIHVEYGTPHQLDDGSFEIVEVKAESNTIDLPDGSSLKDVKTEQIQLVPGAAAGFAGGGFQFAEA